MGEGWWLWDSRYCSKILEIGPFAYLVEHRIRIAERAVRIRYGPPLGVIAYCEGCGKVHKDIFISQYDIDFLNLIVAHSTKNSDDPRHLVKVLKETEREGGEELSDELASLFVPYMLGELET